MAKTRKPAAARKRTRTSAARKPRPKAGRAAARKTTARTRAAAKRGAERRKRGTPETLRLRGFTPSFTANDLKKSLAFYTEALGFFVGERWIGKDGQLQGVMLKAGVCELGLAQDDWAKGRDRKKGVGVRVYCQTVQDIDALAARIKGAGYALSEEPANMEWGGRALSVDDPDGFHLTLFRSTDRS